MSPKMFSVNANGRLFIELSFDGGKLDIPYASYFIDGRSQNRFGSKSTGIYGHLQSVVETGKKFQDLEGDFYQYFDVYTNTLAH